MKKLLAIFSIVAAVFVGSLGCGTSATIEIPDQPVPPPNVDPVTAGSSLPVEPQDPPE